MLAKNLLAVPNQFGNVGNGNAFLEQNADECMPEFVGMRGVSHGPANSKTLLGAYSARYRKAVLRFG